VVASKAARCVLAAPGKLLVDFGLRRAHGHEAGLLAARASYLAGFAGSATVLAGRLFGVPLFGTMAHSYIQAHERETEAFERFAASQPAAVTLLIDTYDTEAAAERVVAIAASLRKRGVNLVSVRIDSGNLGDHARRVRAILDRGGLGDVQIFASGSLDETTIAALLAAGAPIDGFGVGTHLSTASDAPYLDSAYKLQAYAGKPRRKRSEGKATWPGAKQVYRFRGPDGNMERDLVTLAVREEEAEPLLRLAMKDGRRTVEAESLSSLRTHAARELASLPARLRALDPDSEGYPVDISPELQDLARQLDSLAH